MRRNTSSTEARARIEKPPTGYMLTDLTQGNPERLAMAKELKRQFDERQSQFEKVRLTEINKAQHDTILFRPGIFGSLYPKADEFEYQRKAVRLALEMRIDLSQTDWLTVVEKNAGKRFISDWQPQPKKGRPANKNTTRIT
jgi:hypothetical protein